jgi:hypothetical protein
VIASLRDIGDIDERALSANVAFDPDRFQAFRRMRRGITRKGIAGILVLGCEDAISAIDAE